MNSQRFLSLARWRCCLIVLTIVSPFTSLSRSHVSAFLSSGVKQRWQQPHRSTRQTHLTTIRRGQTVGTVDGDVTASPLGSLPESSSPTQRSNVAFTSPPQQVYIEDTDAYGVMYHSNYLRAYDRALQQFFAATATAAEDQQESSVPSQQISSSPLSWSIVKVLKHRFKSSPPLGGTFCVTASRNDPVVDSDSNALISSTREVWDMTMWNANDPTEVYNTATVILQRHDSEEQLQNDVNGDFDKVTDAAGSMNGSGDNNDGVIVVQDMLWYNVYRDEWDIGTPHVPLRTVLNLFERARTTFLGGPNRLRQLQLEHDLLFVVTAIDPCCTTIIPRLATSVTGTTTLPTSINNGKQLSPPPPPQQQPTPLPTSLLVRTTFVPKRRGRIVECRHSLLTVTPKPHDGSSTSNDNNNNNNNSDETTNRYTCLAHGVVTIWALQESTRRPATKPFPDWLQAKMKLKSTSSTWNEGKEP